MNTQPGFYVLQLLPLILLSFALPWYGRSRVGVLFGVSVPIEFAESQEARAMLRRYRYSVLAFTLAVLIGACVFLWLAPANEHARSVLLVLELLELVVTFLLWRRGASAIQKHAASVPLERHTDLTPVSVMWPILAIACSVVPLAFTALWLRLHWGLIPSRFVLHWNAQGVADRWGTRSFDGVYGTPLMGAAMVLLLTLGALFMSRANGPLRSNRRRGMVPMAATSWLLAGSFCWLALRPVLHLSPFNRVTAVTVYIAAIFALGMWQLQRSGLAPFSKSTEAYDSTPDSKWHVGLFYFNPADAAVVVPKRFGWGWTFNFARPTTWVLVGAMLCFVLAMGLVVR